MYRIRDYLSLIVLLAALFLVACGDPALAGCDKASKITSGEIECLYTTERTSNGQAFHS